MHYSNAKSATRVNEPLGADLTPSNHDNILNEIPLAGKAGQ